MVFFCQAILERHIYSIPSDYRKKATLNRLRIVKKVIKLKEKSTFMTQKQFEKEQAKLHVLYTELSPLSNSDWIKEIIEQLAECFLTNYCSMKYLFNLFLLFYFLSYLLPFVDRLSGYELEFQMWDAILRDAIPETDLATIWSIRWMITVLLLVLYWLRIPEIHTWVSLYTDKKLLNVSLLLLLGFLVVYPFAFEYLNWEWGSLIWATLAIFAGITYLIVEPPLVKTEVFHSLEAHLVELHEE